MKFNAKYLIPIFLVALMLPLVGIGHAQAQAPAQDVIWAEVDRAALSTDETLVLTVTLNVHSILSAPRPTLPNLQGFTIVGSSSSSQISIVNGDMTALAVYRYRLQPYETGDLVIEPIQVFLQGQTYSTEPITVRVTQGTGAAPAPLPTQPPAPSAPPSGQPVEPNAGLTGQDLCAEAVVDNPTPYVGEQVVYTFRFYQAVNSWGQPQYEGPTFTGFWTEHQDEQYDYQVEAAGRIYQVVELRTILFPSMVGPVTIDPARVTTPGGFFARAQTLQTRPVELDVRPLPAGAPEGFQGAVGQFTLTGSIDATQGKVNEPLSWEVILSGRGNITAAPDPIWPEMPSWRDFESQATVHSQIQDGQLVGTRTYEQLLVPTASGEFTIPALEYVYFDPVDGEYQTVRTEPIPVSIAPGAAEPSTTLPPIAGKETVEQAVNDIRHLKPVPSELRLANHPVTASALYWAAWVFPVLGAVGYFAWQRRQRYWENNLDLARSSQARKKAHRALARARKQKQDVYSVAGQILQAYLSDKLDRPVAGLTHQALGELLGQKGVNPDVVERVEVFLVSGELGRFAPGADDPAHARSLLRETGRLVDALEKVL